MQKKENFYSDNKDIQFHLDHKVEFDVLFDLAPKEDLEAVGANTVQEYAQTWKDILNTFGEVAGGVLASNQRKVDAQHPELINGEVILAPEMVENLQVLKDIGIAGLGLPVKFGGIPGPIAAELPLVEIVYRACPSTYLNTTWYAPIARVIDEFATDELRTRILPRIISGEWSGSMALTEPDAGSDLAAVRTYGEKQANGSYKLYGSKRFISNGCSQVALVLAKTSRQSKGLDGMNLYMCLRKNDDGSRNYEVTKIEEKPGLHGSPTCELKFDGSIAELIGEEGHGFQYMLHLMNEARIAVGFQGLGIMEASLRLARDYAHQRKSWGRPIAQHELIAEKLLDMEVTTYGLRSLCFQASNALSIVMMASKRLREDESLSSSDRERIMALKTKYTRRMRRWTPLVKYYSGEMAVVHAREALQIHGGYGFTCEYQPEWWVRESLIIPIYEGTSQIQALMCLKDTMKDIIRRPKAFIESALGTKVQVLAERNPLKRKLHKLQQELNASLMAVVFRLLKEHMRATFSDVNPADIRQALKLISRDLVKFENMRPALMHAERITQLRIMVSIGDSLIRDAKADPTRAWIAERWLNRSLPRAAMIHAEIESDEPVFARRLSEVPVITAAEAVSQ